MGAVWLRLRAELRNRWRPWLGLALLVGVAGGVVIGLVAGARRTDSAYSRFLDAQDAWDIVVFNFPDEGGAAFDFDKLARLWAFFADELGILSRPQVPLVTVLLSALGAVALANVIAVLPGRAAARANAAVVLRSE